MHTQKMSYHVLMLDSNDVLGINYSSYIESIRAFVLSASGIFQTQKGTFEECEGGHETIFRYSRRVPKKTNHPIIFLCRGKLCFLFEF